MPPLGGVTDARARTTPSHAIDMRTCCLVNHYNYGAFVGEAVASVLAQTHAVDEIVVVDDGSDQESLSAVEAACALSERVELIAKENEGQLSCFDRGLEASTADLVFFLDADDHWDPGYVERVLRVFEERPEVDFVACNERVFFTDGTHKIEQRPSRDLGYSVIRTLASGGSWIGGPTSCLAIRRKILEQIFPLPNAKGWRVCADEALVYGASLAGARKYFLGEALVNYRVHGSNHFYGKPYDAATRLWRLIEGQRLVEALRRRLSLPHSLIRAAHHEFATHEKPGKDDYRSYVKLVRESRHISLGRKLRVLSAIFFRYRFGMKT